MDEATERAINELARKERDEEFQAFQSQIQLIINSRDVDQLRDFLGTSKCTRRRALSRVLEAQWLEGVRCTLTSYKQKDVHHDLFYECHSLAIWDIFLEFGIDCTQAGGKLLTENLDYPECFDWLLDHGLSINSGPGRFRGRHIDMDGDNTCRVLNVVAARGDVELFEKMVARGADPSRSLALHTACSCTSPEKTREMMTHLLQTYNFDPHLDEERHPLIDFRSFYPLSTVPIQEAMSNRNLAAVEVLLEHGVHLPSFEHALRCRFKSIFRLLLDNGYDPTDCLKSTRYATSRSTQLEATRLCLEYGGDPTPTITYYKYAPTEETRGNMPDRELQVLLHDAKVKWDADGRVTDHAALRDDMKSYYDGPVELLDL